MHAISTCSTGRAIQGNVFDSTCLGKRLWVELLNFSDCSLTAFLLKGNTPATLKPAVTLLIDIALDQASENTLEKT